MLVSIPIIVIVKFVAEHVEQLPPVAELLGEWSEGQTKAVGQPKENRMTNIRNGITTLLALSILAVGLTACEKKEGPAERAGKEVDKAVDTAGQKLEKAGQDIQNAAKDGKK